MKLVAIVLTFNESKHIERCLESLRGVADETIVVDSHSTDDTIEIARRLNATVMQHPFINQAKQFNWALAQLDSTSDWVLRLDADEYLTADLVMEIRTKLHELPSHTAGVVCGRRMTFQGRLIRFGGIFPIRIVRLFRYGRGHCEDRWMDEHIVVDGQLAGFQGDIIDDNLNSLAWWIDKHNRYSSREAIELLNRQHRFLPEANAAAGERSHASTKRWIKENFYYRLPGGCRAAAYFVYRYVLRFGFLDGPSGSAFHVLQGFWYRYVVDKKVAEVNRYLKTAGISIEQAINDVLGIKIEIRTKENS